MTIDMQDLLSSILGSLERIDYIRTQEIPSVDLYVDQVTTFMESKLRNTARNPKTDKILTKTMINNYTKNELLPPPVRKKYQKEHILMLIFIYYFKSVMSITDIQKLLKPLGEKYFGKDSGFDLKELYEEVFGMEEEFVKKLKEDVMEKYSTAQESFGDASSEEREFLQLFSFICMLSFDVYVKKLLIEKLIDGLGV